MYSLTERLPFLSEWRSWQRQESFVSVTASKRWVAVFHTSHAVQASVKEDMIDGLIVESNQEASNLSCWTNAEAFRFETSEPSEDCTKCGKVGNVPSKKLVKLYPSVINWTCYCHWTKVPSSNLTVSWRENDWTSLAPVNTGYPCSTEAESVEVMVVIEAD